MNYSDIVQPLLLDKYQVSMCYAYWKHENHEKMATFDLFFRKSPFKGEYAVFAGLQACIDFLNNYAFSDDDITYLKALPDYKHIEDEFWIYLRAINVKQVKLYSFLEGTTCFPTTPLMRIEGPIAVLQLLETPLLNLTNFASLITTNAARYRLALDNGITRECRLLEFGCRRAQGPDGGLSASKYSFMGGFDATSNLLAGKKFGIPVNGTMGHSFIISYFSDEKDIGSFKRFLINRKTKISEDFTECCLSIRDELTKKNLYKQSNQKSSTSELMAFISYACAFPDNCLCLIDTYDVYIGAMNFTLVALALIKFGYNPIGIRIDSGDLAYMSKKVREYFRQVAFAFNMDDFNHLNIVGSNDLNEETIMSLNDQKHCFTSMGIGTHLVTCHGQPALGCVFKLVEMNGEPCMKLSSNFDKVSIPGKKLIYRLFGRDGTALLDLITLASESPPEAGQRLLCHHPFYPEKRTYITPSRVEPLLRLCWQGEIVGTLPSLEDSRLRRRETIEYLTDDIKRYLNPTPYKVSVSVELLNLLRNLKDNLTPVGELC